MAWYDNILVKLGDAIAGALSSEERKERAKHREYYGGKHKRPLNVKQGKTDDSVVLNFVGLAIDRSVSHVLAGGVEFKLPQVVAETADGLPAAKPEATEQQKYIDDVYEVNKGALLLYSAALQADVYGTGYFKIIPDGRTDPYTGTQYPRLVALLPEHIKIYTNPQDVEDVLSYVIQYAIGDTEYLEVTRHAKATDFETPPASDQPQTWIIENLHRSNQTGGKWVTDNKQDWPYDFPNIVHWKNLPSINSVYGSSGIDDILGIQDKSNATVSYIQKQVRLQQHKQPWGRGINKDDQLDVGPDSLIKMTGESAELGILDFQTDITGSLLFSRDLRQSLFDIAREVDISSITDKLGTLTNFGLRVLYSDSLSKTDTKRELLGEALTELNRRLLVLAGFEGEDSRPGSIAWADPLPTNIVEDMQADQMALGMGIVDPQTVYERYAARYGQEWTEIEARMKARKAGADSDNLGALLLKMGSFNRTGNETPPEE